MARRATFPVPPVEDDNEDVTLTTALGKRLDELEALYAESQSMLKDAERKIVTLNQEKAWLERNLEAAKEHRANARNAMYNPTGSPALRSPGTSGGLELESSRSIGGGRASPINLPPAWEEEFESEEDAAHSVRRSNFLAKFPARERMVDVLVFGSINMDLIASVPTRPAANVTVTALNLENMPGGKGANEAVAVSRLGIPVAMVGRVKSDLFGHQMLSTLTAEGVNIGGVVVDADEKSKSTGVAMIIVAADNTGKNTIACRGSNDDCGLDEAMIADNLMRKRNEVGIVLMQNEVAHEAIVRVAELGHLAEKLVIFKASPLRNASEISDLLYGWMDILVVNEWEAPILLGWSTKGSTNKEMFPLKTLRHSQIAAKELQDKHSVGVVVVVTPAGYVVRSRGGKCEDWLDAMPEELLHDGSAYPGLSERNHALEGAADVFCIPTINVKVVDVIGAGDAGTAGFTAALAEKLPLRYAALWAVSATAMSLGARGAQQSLPNRLEMQQFLRQRGINVDPHMGCRGSDLWPETCPDGPNYREFKHAVIYGDCKDLQLLLDDLTGQGPAAIRTFYTSCVDFSGLTLLHMAVIYGDLAVTVMLLQNGAIPCIGTADQYGLTPLDRAFEGWQMNRSAPAKELFLTLTWLLWTARETNTLMMQFQSAMKSTAVGSISDVVSAKLRAKAVLASKRVSDAAAKAKAAAAAAAAKAAAADNPNAEDAEAHQAFPQESKDDEESRPEILFGMQQALHGHYVDVDLIKSLETVPSMCKAVKSNDVASMLMWMLLGIDSSDRDLTRKQDGPNPLQEFGVFLLTHLTTMLLPTASESASIAHAAAGVKKQASKKSTPTRRNSLTALKENISNTSKDGNLTTQSMNRRLERHVLDLRSLLEKGRTEDGMSLVHAAAYAGSASLLVAFKACALFPTIVFHGKTHMQELDRTDMEDVHGRTPLHYAAVSNNRSTCHMLLQMGYELEAADSVENTPLTLTASPEFRDELLRLSNYRDIFISYGHNEEVNEFVFKLGRDLKTKGVTAWIDTDIAQGDRWRESIQEAIRYSGAVVVMLSRKWIDSTFCRGEVAVALALRKPIYVCLPPLSKKQTVGFADIPADLQQAMSERQFFQGFLKANKGGYDGGLEGFATICKGIKANWLKDVASKMKRKSSDVKVEDKPLLFLPEDGGKLCKRSMTVEETPPFILVACAGSGIEGHFSSLMKDALLGLGTAVKVGVKGQEYTELQKAIQVCSAIVLVMEDNDDIEFINRILQDSSETKPILMCPYSVASKAEAGMNYAAATIEHLRTACFYDWGGNGFQQNSPVFKQLFESFKIQLDWAMGTPPIDAATVKALTAAAAAAATTAAGPAVAAITANGVGGGDQFGDDEGLGTSKSSSVVVVADDSLAVPKNTADQKRPQTQFKTRPLSASAKRGSKGTEKDRGKGHKKGKSKEKQKQQLEKEPGTSQRPTRQDSAGHAPVPITAGKVPAASSRMSAAVGGDVSALPMSDERLRSFDIVAGGAAKDSSPQHEISYFGGTASPSPDVGNAATGAGASVDSSSGGAEGSSGAEEIVMDAEFQSLLDQLPFGGKYVSVLTMEGIDSTETLSVTTVEELKKIGVKPAHARLLKKIGDARTTPVPSHDSPTKVTLSSPSPSRVPTQLTENGEFVDASLEGWKESLEGSTGDHAAAAGTPRARAEPGSSRKSSTCVVM